MIGFETLTGTIAITLVMGMTTMVQAESEKVIEANQLKSNCYAKPLVSELTSRGDGVQPLTSKVRYNPQDGNETNKNGKESKNGNEKRPNIIIGPKCCVSNLYVNNAQPLPYEITFTNVAGANAPAQQVIVTEQLDANLNWIQTNKNSKEKRPNNKASKKSNAPGGIFSLFPGLSGLIPQPSMGSGGNGVELDDKQPDNPKDNDDDDGK